MSETAAVVQRVEEAAGNKPWKLYDGNDTDYATFKDDLGKDAQALVGKRVKLTFSEKPSKDGRFTNRYLDAIEELTSQNGSDPDVDWDLIGLRKTRCVLWQQILDTAMTAGISSFSKAMDGEYDRGQLGAFIASFGTSLRMIAEADIYLAAPVEDKDDWVPFLTKKKQPQGEDIEI